MLSWNGDVFLIFCMISGPSHVLELLFRSGQCIIAVHTEAILVIKVESYIIPNPVSYNKPYLSVTINEPIYTYT